MTFGNPAGAWALLSLLAVLAIHLLQRRRRRVTTSTLFLLERTPAQSLGGRRLERLRRSASLWLQLAAAALLTFALMLPRRVVDDSRQKAVVVLDASVSMSAFRAPLREALARRLAEIARAAKKTDWVLLESAPGRRPLYSGPEVGALLVTLDAWEPREPHHDIAAALETARALAGAEGVALFVTDHEAEVPEGFERLSVGEPIDNVGFVGLDVDAEAAPAEFRAAVRNHGVSPARRDFWIESGDARTDRRTVELAPGEVKVLVGRFPAGRETLVLALEPDRFALDDRAPAVMPRPKRLLARVAAGPDEALVRRWLSSLPAVDVGEPADLVLGPAAAAAPPDTIPSIRWLAGGEARRASGPIVSEPHALVEGLAWHGLAVPNAAPPAVRPGDAVLVWSGARPLVVARRPRQLVLNFPLAGSNAERVPALLVLLHRFVADVRRDKVAPEHANFECRQELAVASTATDPPLRLHSDDARAATGEGPLRAPWSPSFFEVRAGDAVRVTGATHFADAREADFTHAARSHVRTAAGGAVQERFTRTDPLMPLWIGLIGAALLADWGLAARGRG